MMRNPRPEEQLRGGNEPWDRKFEGKSRLYAQKLHIRPDGVGFDYLAGTGDKECFLGFFVEFLYVLVYLLFKYI